MQFTGHDRELLYQAVYINPVTNKPHVKQEEAVAELLARDDAFVKALTTWITGDESVADYEDYARLLKALILSDKLSLRDCLELLVTLWKGDTVPFETVSWLRESGEVEAHFSRHFKTMFIIDAFALFKAYLHEFESEIDEEDDVSEVNPWAIPLAQYLDWGPLQPVIEELSLSEASFSDNKAVWNALIDTRLQLLDHSQL